MPAWKLLPVGQLDPTTIASKVSQIEHLVLLDKGPMPLGPMDQGPIAPVRNGGANCVQCRCVRPQYGAIH